MKPESPPHAAAMYPSVTVARALTGFETTVPAWAALAARSRDLRFFQHPAWYQALFSTTLANPDEFVFVTCQEPSPAGSQINSQAHSQAAAVLPLRLSTLHTLGLPVRTLSLVEHAHASLAGGLFAQVQDTHRLMPMILAALHSQGDLAWDVLRLDKVPERSCGPLPDDSTVQGASAYIDTRTEESAFGPVSKSFSRELRRRTRKAEEVAPLTYEVHTQASALDAALNRWLDVESSGWKGAGGSAIKQDARLTAFYRALARGFGARGECVISILRHGDVDVAAQFGLLVNGTLNLLKIGYHEAHAAYAPGNLIMERTLRWCCENPQVNELSFVTNPPWGHLWKPQHERVFSLRYFNPTPKGHLLHWALRAKQWNERRRAARTVQEAPAQASTESADGVLAG